MVRLALKTYEGQAQGPNELWAHPWCSESTLSLRPCSFSLASAWPAAPVEVERANRGLFGH